MKRNSTVLTVASGKGGVGKSVVATNLAETLAADGHRVALVDADLGQGACSVLMNETPAATIADVAEGTARLEDVLFETAAGLTLAQACAEPGQADRQEGRLYDALDELLARLRPTHTFVVVDTSGGTGEPVRWALDRADLGTLVLVGEPTAVSDAYRLARFVWSSDPAYPLGAIVNFAEDEADAESVADRFGKITEHFIGKRPSWLGWLPLASAMRRSVRDQRPAVRTPGPLRERFAAIAEVVARGRPASVTA